MLDTIEKLKKEKLRLESMRSVALIQGWSKSLEEKISEVDDQIELLYSAEEMQVSLGSNWW